ncbi:DUF341 domain-containing protein [Nannizzia gypsea CBS 118893]|uniref:DUF341 domain-containing protein n=1 Tax=Arthroderma gypseum (strain ATCC MYA-4604 / CBS 118893) TaxID=535722 RepID=E4UTZ9_ARTGP|nr:DUF341 domain-containing protein [Nannizzia gypsea CBS 118893]EFR00805.1 DUF341 domain-containing protein [Nannizzia gypsea CBS 118893]
MRVLCLHGVGSSGALLEAQMANLRRELDPSFELVFVDGQFECERGPGVPEYQAGPFFSHTEGYSPVHISQAVDYLKGLLEDEGPFDGIFGFSQGASLTLSYLYQQQATARPVRVRFACLFSTAMPCSSDAGLGDPIISKLRALEYDIRDRTRTCNNGKDLTIAEQEYVDLLQRTVVDAASHDSLFPWTDMDIYRYGARDAIPRVMCPSLLSQKIQIPTVHAWAQNDFQYMAKMAELAHSICEETMAKTVLHTGFHDIPKRQAEIRAVLRTIDWAIART